MSLSVARACPLQWTYPNGSVILEKFRLQLLLYKRLLNTKSVQTFCEFLQDQTELRI